MANAEHLEFLKKGQHVWTQWRINNPEVMPDLRGVSFHGFSLGGFDLHGADLRGANLRYVVLNGANLRGAALGGAALGGANLRNADLCGADLRGAILQGASLIGANLCQVNLREFDLREFDLSEVDLSGADLSRAQALGTRFRQAIFTGACLEDWNINSATNFDGAICDYVYLKADHQERRPREGNFKPGEFSALFQQALDTVDLIFKDGIDWQAFFQSFQELRSQYTDQDLSIQAIEKKRGGAFVVRVEVAEGVDKAALERNAKGLYETKLALMEQSYRDVLRAKEGEIIAYREQSANLMEIIKLQAARPLMSEGNRYDLRGAQIAGGIADTVQGDQIGGGIINNYGPNTEDITRLLTNLRNQAQTFPTDQRDEALDTLEALQDELAKPEPDQGRIGRRLKRLVALDAAIATLLTNTSGDLTDFTNHVIELTEKLGIPVEEVQLPTSRNP